MLDTWLWILDSRRYTLDAGLWTLSLTVSEQNQNPVSDSAWLSYWKFFGCDPLMTSWHVCSVETIVHDVPIFRNSLLRCKIMSKYIFIVRNRITLQAALKSGTVKKQLSTAIYFRKFLQKIPVVWSFFWSNSRLSVQSSDFILKWLHQNVFLNLPKAYSSTGWIKLKTWILFGQLPIKAEWRGEGFSQSIASTPHY